MMPERWKSSATREMVKAVRDAGGTVERVDVGKLKITGPKGSVTIYEPASDTRRDLRRSSVYQRIENSCGLQLNESHND